MRSARGGRALRASGHAACARSVEQVTCNFSQADVVRALEALEGRAGSKQ